MNQYWWGNINKAAKSAYHTCLTCPKYKPGKLVCIASWTISTASWTTEVWQVDFIQVSPSNAYKYVLDLVYMFPHWTE